MGRVADCCAWRWWACAAAMPGGGGEKTVYKVSMLGGGVCVCNLVLLSCCCPEAVSSGFCRFHSLFGPVQHPSAQPQNPAVKVRFTPPRFY